MGYPAIPLKEFLKIANMSEKEIDRKNRKFNNSQGTHVIN